MTSLMKKEWLRKKKQPNKKKKYEKPFAIKFIKKYSNKLSAFVSLHH